MSEAKWFLRVGEEIIGPFTDAETKQWITSTTGGLDVSVSADRSTWVDADHWLEAMNPRPPTRTRPRVEGNSALPPPVVQTLHRTDRWTRYICWAILLGFIIPRVISGFTGDRLIWIWDELENAPAHIIALILILPASAITLLITAYGGRGARRTGLLVGLPILAFFLFRQGIDFRNPLGSSRRPDALPMIIWLPHLAITIALVAAASRLRMAHPTNKPMRAVMGLGGLAIILIFLLPMEDEKPLISVILEERAWDRNWIAVVGGLSMALYGLIATFALFGRGGGAGLAGLLARLPIILLLLFPILSATVHVERAKDAPTWGVLLNVVKNHLMFSSILVLVGLGWYRGLLAWLRGDTAEQSALEETFS